MSWAASRGRAAVLHWPFRRRFASRSYGLLVLLAVIGGAGWLFKVTPTGFLPSEDQGAVFREVQLPEGPSVNRTAAGTPRIEQIVPDTPRPPRVNPLLGYH